MMAFAVSALLVLVLHFPLQKDAPTGFVPILERDLTGSMLTEGPSGFMVSLDHDKVRVENQADWTKRTKRETPPPDPRQIKFQLDMAHVTWKPGQGVKVSDGWIAGYDVGEFGGGLFWFSEDGKKRVQIDHRNTLIVASTTQGVFAVQALDHLMFWYGDLVEIRPSQKGWSTRVVTSLHVAPRVVIQDHDRFVFGTREYISTLEANGSQRELYRSGLHEMRLDSLVVRMNGDIWATSSRAILRLRRNGELYTAQWFVKAS